MIPPWLTSIDLNTERRSEREGYETGSLRSTESEGCTDRDRRINSLRRSETSLRGRVTTPDL